VIERRVRSIVGADGVLDVDSAGRLEVAPRSEAECALLLSAAHSERWSVRLAGRGRWTPSDAPADLVVSSRRLAGVIDLNPADLVMTAHVGTLLADLQANAAQEGTWIALDPPGTSRSLGSVLATGTAGPLRSGFGAVRNRIMGLTFVTADGRIVRVGGRVVKNVAGFNITSLLIGSFGAFGLITSAHVRLNAMPAAENTLVGQGPRHNLLGSARAILATGTTPAAMELTRDRSAWSLSVRLIGSETAVAADRRNITAATSNFDFNVLDGESSADLWASTGATTDATSVTIRMGSLQSELETALDLLRAELDGDANANVSVSVLSGVIRWSGEARASKIQNLRNLAAERGWPVTVERAPWEVLSRVGHYGAFRSGVGRLVTSLRSVFDTRGLLVTPLDKIA